MNVIFYHNSSDNRAVNKTISQVASVTCTPFEDVNIHKPVFITAYTSAISNANYMYVPNFNRYYYVQTALLPGGKCAVSGEVDVLMSHADGIRGISCVIGRQAAGKNFDIADSNIATKQRKNVVEYNATGTKVFHGYLGNTTYNCVLSLSGALTDSSPLDGYKLFVYSTSAWAAEWASCYIWYRQNLYPITNFYETKPEFSDVVAAWGANSIYIVG